MTGTFSGLKCGRNVDANVPPISPVCGPQKASWNIGTFKIAQIIFSCLLGPSKAICVARASIEQKYVTTPKKCSNVPFGLNPIARPLFVGTFDGTLEHLNVPPLEYRHLEAL